MSSFRGSFADCSDGIRVNHAAAVPAEATRARTNQHPPTAMLTPAPGNVQWHQEEFPTCNCHMKLQVAVELASQQDVCCFASIRKFPFSTFLLPAEPGG